MSNPTALLATPATHAVSVLPRSGCPVDVAILVASAADAGELITDRGLRDSAIVYVFVRAESPADALRRVAAIVGDAGTVIETHAARDAARRVTIDPRLIEAAPVEEVPAPLEDRLDRLYRQGARFRLEQGEATDARVLVLLEAGAARTFRDGAELWLELTDAGEDVRLTREDVLTIIAGGVRVRPAREV